MNHKLEVLLVCLQIILQLLTEVTAVAERLGCKDENGNKIDWFYLYKLPNSFEGNEFEKKTNSGLNYLYITPATMTQWTMSERLINETASMPGETLSFIYKQKDNDNLLVMMYNDEPTNAKTDGTRGHTKGVVVANDISGFWLIHSVPKFPPALEEGHYDYPKTGEIYGQSFLCISFTGDQMAKVGKQLQFNEPHFYSSQVPHFLKSIYPELVEALTMKTKFDAPYYNTETLQSRHGSKFLSFAKSRKFNKELYEDFVAPFYNAGDYYVETWRHGPGNIDSDCQKPSKVYNIDEISLKSSNITFKTLKDHSKWMVSPQHDLICVGDVNRQEHQKVRGGGTVCQQSKVSSCYNELIAGSESCKKKFMNDISQNEISKQNSNEI